MLASQMNIATAAALLVLVSQEQQLEPEAEKPSVVQRVNMDGFIPTFALQMPADLPSECPAFHGYEALPSFFVHEEFADGTQRGIFIDLKQSGDVKSIMVRMGPSDDGLGYDVYAQSGTGE